ncbi:MAG: fused MFS/spermidine synthase [Singulisphaera sp.]
MLSSTGPLVQAWFGRAYPGTSPYRLYALSNVGSLAALITYPFVFEPALGVDSQARLWSCAFVVFAVSCGLDAARISRLRRPEGLSSTRDKSAGDGEAARGPASRTAGRILWLALPACASLMLLATTNHACQDVAAIPFLWIIPLGLYLLSFIICFDHGRWYRRGAFAGAALTSILAVAGISGIADLFDAYRHPFTFIHELTLYFSALFFICMVCHGELMRLRPSPRHLTEYYLMIAAGGALGGIFVSLIAPLLFSTFLEWDIGLVLSATLAASVLLGVAIERPGRPSWLPTAGAAVVAAGLGCILLWNDAGDPPVAVTRNFYGVVSVSEVARHDPERHRFTMMHGRIPHGRQFASPVKRRIATTYYSEGSGVGQAMTYRRDRGRLRVGAVGLGVGTLATYARPGDSLRFYEINPEVLRLANAHFTYLKDCEGTCDVVMGDARVSLERETPQAFNVLVLDAFSGDSIPTHLLTKEAFRIYLKHLEDDGVFAVHITNRYLNLAPVVRRLAVDSGLKVTRIFAEGRREWLTYDSDWMLLTRDERFLSATPTILSPDSAPELSVPLWTDDYSNLFQILLSE